jgi:hypothetical protein
MARVRFTQDFDYRPKANVVISYKADNSYTVRREAADQAIAAGAASEEGALSRDEARAAREEAKAARKKDAEA